MRRRAGVGAIQKQRLEQERYKDKVNEIQEIKFDQLTKQFDAFRDNLEEFASKYRQEIIKKSSFRLQFQKMCATIGVDPLTSNKGFWSVLNLSDFYNELSVQIIEVCLATNATNGGMILLEELRERLIKSRGKKQSKDISHDDILRAVKKLSILGNGFRAIKVGDGKYLIQSVPGEISMDHDIVFQEISSSGKSYITVSVLQSKHNWSQHRSRKVLEYLVQEGIAWIDMQAAEEYYFWFPTFFTKNIDSSPDILMLA